jgi:hypothetical protein
MGREKITISLSTKCLELIDEYAETTGFEARSRVIEEAIFSICDLLNDKSKLDGILDRFRRFPVEKSITSNGKKYVPRKVDSEKAIDSKIEK